jgi:hypothetical protein
MSLRLKSAQISVLAAICGCCLMPNAVHAGEPVENPQMAKPASGQSDTSGQGSQGGQGSPGKSSSANDGQGASAQTLQGKLESDNASGSNASNTLQGKTQSSGQSSLKTLKAKTSATRPLEGSIHATGTVLPAFKLHMTQAELKAAVAQYSGDLRQFYLHVQDYHSAQVALKKQIGECTENEQQWKAKLEKDKLQVGTVVIATGITDMPPPPPTPPVIAPPRICCVGCLITGRCGHLGTGGGGGTAAPKVNGYDRADAMRIKEATVDLAKAQNRLAYSEKENAFTSQNAINEAQIEQSQQNLAEKFGRLQQEFDTLKIEKEALTGAKVK